MTDRVLIVANRLPVTLKVERGQVDLVASSGGLASGLRSVHERTSGLWIGWPGDISKLDPPQITALDARLAADGAVPVHLTPREIRRYYDSFSNGVLWPLFHYQLDRIPPDSRDWDIYQRVNQRFADAVIDHHRPGDLVWVHDYQLMLVPALIRRKIPEARIGFFLHIPFPSTEVFRTLPWRDNILEGLLGADLVGFHAFSYARHFTASILRILGVEPSDETVSYAGREVRFGIFPMGIDFARFSSITADAGVRAEAHAIKDHAKDQSLFLGVDRLDYVKGIPRRLLAFERLIERNPSTRGRVRLTQLAVPSRTHVEEYEKARSVVNEIVGRVNGTFGSVTWTPIQYLYRSVSQSHLVALYRAADVMMVTPLQDGMNLVAKEFVAARDDEDGVLVLSEFAGASAELGDALVVNPYDIDGTAAAMRTALEMPQQERQARMTSLRRRVSAYDVGRWADQFLDSLASAARVDATRAQPGFGVSVLLLRLVLEAHRAKELILYLDYDGTLVSVTSSPGIAIPDQELLDLLQSLAARRGTSVHVVSGRAPESLDRWLGSLPIVLHAEHGLWYRPADGKDWQMVRGVASDWKTRVRGILDEFAARTPGAFVEEKSASLAWHYRLADPEFGLRQAKELRIHLGNVFANVPIEVLLGDKVIDVRAQGVNKGLVVDSAELERADRCVIAMGNDRTDEDLFAALPETAFTVHVGVASSRARYRLPNPAAARAVLRAIADAD